MIHQGCHPYAVVAVEKREAGGAVWRRNLAAKMDEMIGPQPVLPDTVLDGVGELAHFQGRHVGVVVETHAKRVEHRRYSGGGNLCVMGKNSRNWVPADFRPRCVMSFQMVGVKLDQARDQIVALQIVAGA